jgi:putative endonuclease
VLQAISGPAFIRIERSLPGFSNRYNVSKLVYYEAGYDASGVIAREKQIKAGSRQKKIDLINRLNPEWRDLYDDLKRDRFVAPLLA